MTQSGSPLGRRRLLAGAGTLLAASGLGLFGFPRMAFAGFRREAASAGATNEPRLVVILLRGGLDGLAMLPPYGDPAYVQARAGLALPPPGEAEGVIDLDGLFGLHPSLAPLAEFFAKGEFGAVHAIASPYRERSHFDAQDVLESGVGAAGGAQDGWLNRAMAALGDGGGGGLAVNRSIPLILRGKVPVVSWVPSNLPAANPDFLARVAALYQADQVLGPALAQGLEIRALADRTLPEEDRRSGRDAGSPDALRGVAMVAGEMLKTRGGPRVAVLEAGGWDTHANQGTTQGALTQRLGALAAALTGLAEGLGPVWKVSVVVAVSEFGRTIAPNGTKGTDHGTGGAALLMGGAIKGGRVLGSWPGLSTAALYQGRDLMPTTDLRALFKGLLRDHMRVPEGRLEDMVFPDSRAAKPLDELIRT